jgi:PKHD-type hydroxylase
MYSLESAVKENDNLHEPLVYERYFDKKQCAALRYLVNVLQKDTGTVQDGYEEDAEGQAIGEDQPETRVVDTYSFGFDDEFAEASQAIIDAGIHEEGLDWLFAHLEALILDANEEYEFDLHGINETVNLLHYKTNQNQGVAGHYIGHTDFGPGFLSTRKLTIIIQLSDEKEYDGCRLNLIDWSDEDYGAPGNAPVEQGSLIVFPSYMYHSVSPIARGERYCLNLWVNGPAFR